MLSRLQRLIALFALASLTAIATIGRAPAAAPAPDSFTSSIQPALEEHCVQCHGKDGKVKGKVNLLELKSVADLAADPELLDDIIGALEFEEMPPEDEPQPSAQTRAQLVTQLEEILHTAVTDKKHLPRIPIRRMNRFQYSNAVQDLFELTPVVFTLPERMLREHGNYFNPASGVMPENVKAGSRPLGKSQLIEKRLAGVAPFPQDLRAEHGFDNRGDHLSLSPLLLESFLTLSRSIVESRDFNEKNCGIWNDFFAPPRGEASARAVRTRLRTFLTRAFRRPVENDALERYTSHVLSRLESGETFTESMKAAASAALASPRFLYLYDRASSGPGAEPLDDFDLASRLSFFLWGSIPDEELHNLATSGELHLPEILSSQVDRMLNDRKLKRFCDSFPSQWLQLERIVSSSPNREIFPQFWFHSQYRSSMHMMLEPLLLFETVLIEDRPILDFIDSDYSYRSALLDTWYGDRDSGDKKGRTGVQALAFRRVPLSDRREGGLITNAAVMTMTSGPNRTHPITRGAWIAGVIFNDPPEPPPADVPPLSDEVAEEEENLTLRERFVAHRERPDCAGCHAQIDPLGFAFENYDPIGIWRDYYENGREVDASGTLFRKHKFTNPVEFKDAILAEKDRFVRGFAAHLLSFALGREVSAADSPALDRILAESTAAGYRFRPLIREIVLSDPFLYKNNSAKPAKAVAHQQ